MPPLSTADTQYQLQLLKHQHLAPYLGECKVHDTRYLIWEASGGEYTLEDYIEMDNGWLQLAADLGLSISCGGDEEETKVESMSGRMVAHGTRQQREHLHSELAEEVLRQILQGLAYCHSCGIVHRDIKVQYGDACYVVYLSSSSNNTSRITIRSLQTF